MKTETEIILALEDLKRAYQLKLKNIETAITCISTASMIVDAVSRCHAKNKKYNFQTVPPPTTIGISERTVKEGNQKRKFGEKKCEACGDPFLPTHNKQRFCKKECNPNVAKKNPTGKMITKWMLESTGKAQDDNSSFVFEAVPIPEGHEQKHVDAIEFKEKLEKIKKTCPPPTKRPEIDHVYQ